MLQRAYSLFEIKSVDDAERVLTGIATTPKTDRYGDIVEPKGAQFTLPIPFLWQHKSGEPIGHVTEATVTDAGIVVRVELQKYDEPGELKNLLDKAWGMIKTRLVRGLSIGFMPVESANIEGSFWAQRFLKWDWMELSAVTIPANIDATIQTVKSFDLDAPAAPGTERRTRSATSPGASGRPVRIPTTPPKAKGTMTIRERIAAFEAARQAKNARMNEITDKAGAEGRTKDAAEREEFDALRDEIASIDLELRDLREMDRINLGAATAVNGSNAQSAAASRGGSATGSPVIRVQSRAQPGIGFARLAMVILRNKGNLEAAAKDARRSWPDQAAEIELALQQKAAVAPGTTTDATWASPLVQPTTLASEFLEFLRPKTVLGRIPNLTKVDFNSRVTSQTGTGTYGWVGEAKPKPLTALAFAAVTLAWNKVSGIIVLTKETIRFSTPSAETKVRDDMTKGIANFMDNQFLDSTITAIAGVRPAAITEGIAGFAATGTTEAAARADIRTLINSFVGGNLDDGGLVLLMKPGTAFTLGTMVNALGQQAFPGMTIEGGSLLGIPVVTANATALASQIVALHAPSILVADDGAVEIDMSEEASLEMESAPTNPLTSTTVLTSLWQHNMVGLRAERYATWMRGRSGSVNRITGVAYA